jgi:hypothetical protein
MHLPDPRHQRHTVVLLIGTAFALACAGSDRSGTDAAPFEVVSDPILSLGVASGDSIQEFFRIVTPFLMPDGRIAVPVGGTYSIRIFKADGSFGRELGRQGRGPGEFVSLTSAWARGDTIEAYDARLARLTRFLPDSGVEIVTIQNPPQPSMTAIPGVASDGWVLAGVSAAAVGTRDRISISRFGGDGTLISAVAETEGIARYQSEGSSGPEPLSPRARIRVANQHIFVAETLNPTIQVYRADGAAVREIRWPHVSTLDPRAIVQAVIDSAVTGLATDRAQLTRQRLQAAPVPVSLSAFWDFIVDDQDLIWVQSYDPLLHAAARNGLGRGSYLLGPTRGAVWTVLTPDGNSLGTVAIPGDLELVQITSDAVLGIAADSSGVESVRVHRLIRH